VWRPDVESRVSRSLPSPSCKVELIMRVPAWCQECEISSLYNLQLTGRLAEKTILLPVGYSTAYVGLAYLK